MTKPYKSGWRIVMFLGPHPAFCCMYCKQQKAGWSENKAQLWGYQYKFVVYMSFTIDRLIPATCSQLVSWCMWGYAEKEEGEERGNKATLTFNMLTCGLLFHFNCLLRRMLPNNYYYLSTIHSQLQCTSLGSITHRWTNINEVMIKQFSQSLTGSCTHRAAVFSYDGMFYQSASPVDLLKI